MSGKATGRGEVARMGGWRIARPVERVTGDG